MCQSNRAEIRDDEGVIFSGTLEEMENYWDAIKNGNECSEENNPLLSLVSDLTWEGDLVLCLIIDTHR